MENTENSQKTKRKGMKRLRKSEGGKRRSILCIPLKSASQRTRKVGKYIYDVFTSSTKTSTEEASDQREVDEAINVKEIGRETFYTCEDLSSLDATLPNQISQEVSEERPIKLQFERGSIENKTQQLVSCSRGNEENLPFNEPAATSVFSFDSELFTGKALFRFKNIENESEEYFQGRKRRQQWVIQGTFKQKVCVGDIFSGYELKKPAQNLPSKFIVNAALGVLRKVAPTLKADIFAEKPYVITPLLQTIQTLDVSPPGHEPFIGDREIEEHNGILFASENKDKDGHKKFNFHLPLPHLHHSSHEKAFKKKGKSAKERKKYFSSVANGKKHDFVPGFVYTFEFYEDKFDARTFKLLLPLMSFDLTKYLGTEPVPMMAKVLNPEEKDLHEKYLFNFSLYHKTQLEEKESEDQVVLS